MASQQKNLTPSLARSAGKYRTWFGIRPVVALLGSALLSATGVPETMRQEATPPPPATQQQAPPPVEHPSSASIPSSPEAVGGAPLRVMVGKSLLINTSERLKRVSVTDPAIAD